MGNSSFRQGGLDPSAHYGSSDNVETVSAVKQLIDFLFEETNKSLQ